MKIVCKSRKYFVRENHHISRVGFCDDLQGEFDFAKNAASKTLKNKQPLRYRVIFTTPQGRKSKSFKTLALAREFRDWAIAKFGLLDTSRTRAKIDNTMYFENFEL